MEGQGEAILRLKAISKSFPGVQALDGVSFDLFPGEVHALVGENGAGKSTLMKILAGACSRDSGEIIVNGEAQGRWTPSIARAKGVGMVYQEFNLVPFRDVAENIFLGREKRRWGLLLDKAAMHREAAERLRSIGVEVDTHVPVGRLGVGQQQMVEIAKALLLEVRALVLDEPTSALTVREIGQLFETIRRLKKLGVGIVYISHRMEEVPEIGDRISVLRDGRHIGTLSKAEYDIDRIVKMMVGREIKDLFPRHFREPGEVALRVEDLRTRDKLRGVRLEVRYGEIVGLAGLVGAGRTETARAIFGLDQRSAGAIEVNGARVERMSPSRAIALGMGFAPEDRKRDGLFKILSMSSNVVMAGLGRFFPGGIATRRREERAAKPFVDSLRVQPPQLRKQVQFLSGGNQQKVVVAKWLAVEPRVLIFDEPTRGIDVGAKAEIHALMDKLANEGHAILMISSELPEVLGMSDRVYVMREGEVAGEFGRAPSSEDVIACAMGVPR